MAMTAVLVTIDEERAVRALREAGANLDRSQGEVFLDFSSVRRIDSAVLQALEEFACIADERTVKVLLRGAQVDVYKVLKLVKLTGRFSFVS